MSWLDRIHADHLPKQPVTSASKLVPHYTLPPNHQGPDDNVASSLNKLATTLDFHYENELKERAEKRNKGWETIWQFIISVENNHPLRHYYKGPNWGGYNQPGTDIHNENTTGADLKSQSSGTAPTQIFEAKHICLLSYGMCTSIKQGTIASQQSYTNINGISPFCTPKKTKTTKWAMQQCSTCANNLNWKGLCSWCENDHNT